MKLRQNRNPQPNNWALRGCEQKVTLIDTILKQLSPCDIISYRWCSILVSNTVSEDGAKNPLKGKSMKFLVPATDAQLGAGAGS